MKENVNDKILVTRSSMPPLEEFVEQITPLWENHWLTNMGELHNTLQKQLCCYLGVENISLFTNGHMALELLLQAMGLQGEVITTPFTFASTTHAIVRNGLTPVFCDINKDSYTIDSDKIEELITEKTCAILPVHVYGNICDVKKIEEIATKHKLKVIYDAAHAFGVKINGKSVCHYGDASMLSFHATKVYNTIEGGAVCYKDENLGNRLYELKNFGIKGPEIVDSIGANAKMNEFQAAMGICNLRHIDEEIEKRENVFRWYQERLMDVKGIQCPQIATNVVSNYAYYPILVDEKQYGISRDELYENLIRENIYTRKYFYPLTTEYQCYKGRFNKSETPVALEISNKVLTLPMYADLTKRQVTMICDKIRQYSKNGTVVSLSVE